MTDINTNEAVKWEEVKVEESTEASPAHLLEIFLDETKEDLDAWAEAMNQEEVDNGFAPSDEEKQSYKAAEALYNEIYRLREFELNYR